MIYFRSRPDPVFLAILNNALEAELQEIARISAHNDVDSWKASYSRSSLTFTPYSALITIEQLLKISRVSAIYRLTDFHWLLLYECAKNYCAIHNDLLTDEPEGCLRVGAYRLREINFDEIIQIYFWDTEFLIASEMEGGLTAEEKPESCEQEESVNLAEGLHPHPNLLEVKQVTDPVWLVKADDEYFMPGSRQYPDRGF